MASFWDSLTQKFKSGSMVIRLVFINVAVFLILRVSLLAFSISHSSPDWFLHLFEMPSDFASILMRPWTVFTYMFVHIDFLHILLNMVWLYFFGNYFLRWFNNRQLGGLYLLGGLFGGLFFALFNQLLPSQDALVSTYYLLGASASVLALGLAVAFYRPDEPIQLFLFGTVKLKYLAMIMVVMDILNLNGENAGGSLAHLGGALAGLAFGFFLRKGVDLTAWVNPILDWFVTAFRPRPKMKVSYQRPKHEQANKTVNIDQQYRDQKKKEAEQMDAILDKIKRSGYGSLSESEKKQLFDFSKK